MTLAFSRIQDWFRYWWLKVPDPRIISIIVGTVYLFGFFLLGGVGTLTNPPVTIIGEVGEVTMTTVGFLFLVGAVIGMIGGTLDHWELERVGVVTMGLGALVYAYIVISLHYTSTGSRLTQLAMILAGLGFLGLRLAMIWRYDYKPRG
ncbi:MAG: hypothetical protein WDA07_13200 [Leucobacter sp.]